MIKCTYLELDGALLFESKIFKDSRGSFCEVYKEQNYIKFLPENIQFVQDNESFSTYGVLRGLHFQKKPFQQSKLVRVSYGEIQDVIVDIRMGSNTFGKHLSIILSKENGKQLFVPKGFAHGFLILSENAIINYKVDSYYSKNDDLGILFKDADLGIKWNIDKSNLCISQKDLNLPELKDIVSQ